MYPSLFSIGAAIFIGVAYFVGASVWAWRVIGGAGGDVGRRGGEDVEEMRYDEEDSIWRWMCDWGGSDEVMPLISVPKLEK